MRNALVVITVGVIMFGPSLTAVAQADESFNVEAPLNRDGPRLMVRVASQRVFSNWHYNLHVTTTGGLDQHFEIPATDSR